MAVDTVIRPWVIQVEIEEAGPDGFGWVIQWLEALIYHNDILPASPSPDRLQVLLYVLTGPFNRVGLQTNLDKTVVIVGNT